MTDLVIEEGTHGDVLEAIDCEIITFWSVVKRKHVARVRDKITKEIISEREHPTHELACMEDAIKDAAEKKGYNPSVNDPMDRMAARMDDMADRLKRQDETIKRLQGGNPLGASGDAEEPEPVPPTETDESAPAGVNSEQTASEVLASEPEPKKPKKKVLGRLRKKTN